jgi:hypothetical protein
MSIKPPSITFKPAGKNKPCTTIIEGNLNVKKNIIANCNLKVKKDLTVNKCLNVKNIVYTTETINETGKTVSGEKSLTWINTCGTGVLADGIKDGFYKKIIKVDENSEQILENPNTSTGVNESFGWSVSMSTDGKYAVVGVPNWQNDYQCGRAFVYGLSGGSWTSIQELTASDGVSGDQFAWSVSISGDSKYIAIGSIQGGDSGTGITGDGAVYVYEYDGTSWTGEEKVIASDGEINDQFGYSLAISDDGNRLVVGAPFTDSLSNNDEGSVYFYEYGGTGIGWTGEQRIDDPRSIEGDRFGWSVDISNDGNYAILGSFNDSGPGEAYMYGLSGGSWTSIQELTASDGGNIDRFGFSVSITKDGKYIAIGSINEDTGVINDGAVYIYKYDGTIWTNEEKLISSDGQQFDRFGNSVSISSDGKYLIVGTGNFTNLSGRPGKAYIFYREDGQWIEKKINNTDSPQNNDRFGYSVSISENGCYSIVGKPSYNDGPTNNVGRAYIYNNNFYCLEYNDIDSVVLTDEGDSACFVYNEDYGKWVKYN